MSVRIKKTGEVVNLLDYDFANINAKNNYAKYIDGSGTVHHVSGFYFQDVFEACGETENLINWEQRRYEVAKEVICAQITAPIIPGVDLNTRISDIAKLTVMITDALIKELKKGGCNGSH